MNMDICQLHTMETFPLRPPELNVSNGRRLNPMLQSTYRKIRVIITVAIQMAIIMDHGATRLIQTTDGSTAIAQVANIRG